MEAVCHILRSFGDKIHAEEKATYTPEVREALQQQEKIGFRLFSRGHLATGWLAAMELAGLSSPEGQMNALQQIIWEEWAFPIWTMRNSILHGPNSKYLTAEDRDLSERILWFLANKERVSSIVKV